LQSCLSIVAAIDGLAGISNSAMSLLMIAELEDHVARLEQPTELRAALSGAAYPASG